MRQTRFPYITTESVSLGMVLAVVGGFLDAYTYITRDGVFANAQTGNVVLLGVKAAQGHWTQALLHIPPILAFVVGVAVVETFKHPRIKGLLRDPARAILLIESVVLFIVGTLPRQVPNMVVTVIISFIASVQVSSFRKLVKWTYNTTMITGNLRTASQAAYLAIVMHDREAADQCTRFFTIILSFLVGALFGTLSSLCLGNRVIWVAAAVLICVLLLLKTNRHPNDKSVKQPRRSTKPV